MRIGYRTIKTAIGTPIAISIAQFIGLTNFISAGIITMLCIQPSRKRSVKSAWERFISCILGIIFSVLLFEVVGYHPLSIGILLVLFIPVTVFFKITEGIVTSSVIILNLYSTSNITAHFIGEQLLIILIGIGTALIINIHMPSLEHKLKKKQKDLEENFQKILYEISLFIKEENMDWDGQELIYTEEILNEAFQLVETDMENQLLKSESTYADYFQMREKQLRNLQRMLPLVSTVHQVSGISDKIASFFEQLSKSVHSGNTAIIFLEQLTELRKTPPMRKLPKSREEFETRANLFRLLHEIEDYLRIKHEFKESDILSKGNKEKTE